MSERDEAVKILGQAGLKVRRTGQRTYIVERKRCSSSQLVKLAAIFANGLDDVSHGIDPK